MSKVLSNALNEQPRRKRTRYRIGSVPTGMIELPSYNHIDLSAAWSPIDRLLLRLHVKNILDNDKEQAVGFYNIGRSLTLGLSKEF